MNRENARQEIRQRISCKDYLQKSKSGLYCCPYCGSGNGSNGTGAAKYYEATNTWHCFACDKTGDVIDLYREANGTDYNTALSLMAQELGITIDTYRPDAAADFAHGSAGGRRSAQNSPTSIDAPADIENATEGAETPTEEQADYTAYYRECRERLQDPAALEYLRGRGITQETAAAYWIGFDPAADPAGAGYPAPRIIIPVNAGHYIARAIDPANKMKKLNPKGSTPGIFNIKALYAQEVQEVFITEGAFDALSIIEAGSAAVATNSTANAQKLLEQLERERTQATIILAFDNDPAGKKATETMRQGLQRLNISFTIADICGDAKDPNEALQKDPAAFAEAISAAKAAAAAKPDNISLYIDNLMGEDIAQFKHEIKTGYANLDRIKVGDREIDNGLYSGLYCIAAISSLGKTTFCAQMADQIAAAGNDVLYFSLEQSRLEMVSKSIARITAQKDINTAVTSLQIRKGYLPGNVLAAAEQYKKTVGDRVSIIEGNFTCDVSFISNYIAQYMRRNPGTQPVIFVDYLQILQPETNAQGRQQTTRETVDTTITTLKRISREYGLTVFVISSVNRSNYLLPIDFESIKESGGVEYTCDCVWGLQFQCLNDELFSKEKGIKEKRARIKAAKASEPRKIELVCLKNRYGIANYSAYFNYYPAHDLFTPCSDAELDFEADEQPKAGRKA